MELNTNVAPRLPDAPKNDPGGERILCASWAFIPLSAIPEVASDSSYPIRWKNHTQQGHPG